MIWAADQRGHIAYVCREWQEMTGQDTEQACGSGWLDMVHPEDRGLVAKAFTTALTKATSFTMTYRLRSGASEYIWVRSSAIPSFCPNTSVFLGYLGSLSSGGEHQPTSADAQLDVFDPPEPSPGLEPLSSLDRVADHLMLAHSAAQAARDTVLMQMIEISLFQVGKLLSQQGHATHGGNVH